MRNVRAHDTAESPVAYAIEASNYLTNKVGGNGRWSRNRNR
jgi:hypothetical protein